MSCFPDLLNKSSHNHHQKPNDCFVKSGLSVHLSKRNIYSVEKVLKFYFS